jgi:hypothetical protein
MATEKHCQRADGLGTIKMGAAMPRQIVVPQPKTRTDQPLVASVHSTILSYAFTTTDDEVPSHLPRVGESHEHLPCRLYVSINGLVNSR